MIVGIFLLVAWLGLVIRYPSKALPVSLAAVALLAAVAAWVIWQQTRLDHRLKQLEITISYDPTHCNRERPLRTEVRNTSDRVLTDLSWNVSAFLPGNTTDLASRDFGKSRYVSPAGIQPAEIWQTCLEAPVIRSGYRAQSLDYKAHALEGRFE